MGKCLAQEKTQAAREGGMLENFLWFKILVSLQLKTPSSPSSSRCSRSSGGLNLVWPRGGTLQG